MRCRNTAATNAEDFFLESCSYCQLFPQIPRLQRGCHNNSDSVFPRSKLSLADRVIVLGDLRINLTGNVEMVQCQPDSCSLSSVAAFSSVSGVTPNRFGDEMTSISFSL